MRKNIPPDEIKPNAVYIFSETAKLLRMCVATARIRRHKKMPMPKSFKLGRRILTRGSSIFEFIKEREK